MLTIEDVINIAVKEIRSMAFDNEVIISGPPLRKAYGWVVFYNSRKYLETGDRKYSLLGNMPMYIDSKTGDVDYVSIVIDVDEDPLDYYEKQRYMQG